MRGYMELNYESTRPLNHPPSVRFIMSQLVSQFLEAALIIP